MHPDLVDSLYDAAYINKAKLVIEIGQMQEVKRWLINNIKNTKGSWSIADHRGRGFNWKSVAGVTRSNNSDLAAQPITLIVSFLNREDLMLFLLRWPSDVLVDQTVAS